jgi:hypothetical protein
MGVIEAIVAISEALKAIFGFSTKVADSKRIQEEKFSVIKIKYTADRLNRLADEFFGDLKNHTELTVEDKVNFECADLEATQKALLIKILNDRILEYRKKNAWARPKFKKWLKENNTQ